MTKKPSKRRENDRYLTPRPATQSLIDAHPEIRGPRLLDPCCGDGRMSQQLLDAGRFQSRLLNDLQGMPSGWSLDASRPESWDRFDAYAASWVISNLPFGIANAILIQALGRGYSVAALLRLTFLEPVEDRQWLTITPPTALVVLPRYSYTIDGKTDSVTCAWHIWGPVAPGIKIVRAESVGQERLVL